MLHPSPRLVVLCLLSALLAAGPLAALAQAVYTLPPPRVPVAQAPAALYVAQVVDARPQHAVIGRVVRNAVSVPVAWEQDLPTTVQAFYGQYAAGQPGATPLLLRVRALSLAESPQATAAFIGDFYSRWPDGSYRRLAYVAHRQVARGAFLATAANQHAVNLGDLLLGALLLARNPRAWLPDSTHYPAAYVLAPAPQPAEELPVLAAGWQPRPGIYHTVEEFWHNAPSEPGRPLITARPYHTAEWAADSQLTLARRLPTGQLEPVVGAWGFSDGRRLYLLHGQEYHPLTRRGAGFVFYGEVGDDPNYQAAARSQSPLLMGSAVGLALTASQQAAAPSLHKRVLFSFDPLTATASLDGAVLAPPLAARPTQLYVYRARGAKGPAVRVGVAGGDAPRELQPGDYLTFTLPGGQPVQLCASREGQPDWCLPVTPLAEGATYLECVPLRPATPLQPVPVRAGMAALERLVR